MSIAPDEFEQEEALDRLYKHWENEYAEKYRKEGEGNFLNQRLASYFISKPNMDALPLARLHDARKLLEMNPEASLVFAQIATEVGVNDFLFRPVIFGFSNSDYIAEVLSNALIRSKRDQKGIRHLVSVLVMNLSGPEIEAIEIDGENLSLWSHIDAIQRKRNRILHNAEGVERKDAERALVVASTVVERLYPWMRYTMLSMVETD